MALNDSVCSSAGVNLGPMGQNIKKIDKSLGNKKSFIWKHISILFCVLVNNFVVQSKHMKAITFHIITNERIWLLLTQLNFFYWKLFSTS